MHDSLPDRVLWAVAHIGLGVFWSVVALQQFGNAWTVACGIDTGEGTNDVGLR